MLCVNLLQNKKIAIVGGGPGGLTLARLLQMKGADVKGAIVDLHFDSGLKVMEAADLMDVWPMVNWAISHLHLGHYKNYF